MIKKLRIRVLPILLIIVILFSSMGAALAKPIKTYIETANGITYTVQTWKSGNKEHITARTDKDPDYLELIVDVTNKEVSKNSYDFKGKGFLGEPKYSKKSEIIDCSDYENTESSNVNLQAITWQKKYMETFENDYWFMQGTEGTKEYRKIGCVATYQLNYSSLIKDKRDKIDDYTNAILSCRTFMNDAKASLGIESFAAILVIVFCMLAFPVAAIIAACTGVCGSAAAGVYFIIDAHGQYEIIQVTYTTIKTYGTKL